MSTPKLLDPQTIEALRSIDACRISNAIETFGVRLKNEGFSDGSVRAMVRRPDSMVGYAATCRFRSSGPPPRNHVYYDRTDWWNYIQTIPAPRVVVIQDVDRHPGLGASIGEVHTAILQALKVVGCVTNGAVRDLGAVEKTGFHLFAGGLSVSHAYSHIIDFGTPVEVGTVHIEPGELIHGDLHGFQTVPLEIADQIQAETQAEAERENEILRFCQSPDFSIDRLRELVRRAG